MSFEQPPMLRQSQVVSEIAKAVVAGQNLPWERLQLRLAATTSRISADFTRQHDGVAASDFAPRGSTKLVPELRTVMYRPGAGTWFEMELTIDASGRVTTRFNYDDEPQQHTPFTPGEYLRDQEQFPRDLEHQPEWLRAKLAEAAANAADAANVRFVDGALVLQTTRAWGVLQADATAAGLRDHPTLADLFDDEASGTDDDIRRWYTTWFPLIYPGTAVTDYQVIPRSVDQITLTGDPDTLHRIAQQPW